MNGLKLTYRYLLIITLLITISCREEIELETATFESVLVVEATITNELKHQEIKISRTSVLEETDQIIENNATVFIEDNNQNIITFTQNLDGVYVSDNEFQADTQHNYTLHITTTNGKNYQSNTTTLTPESTISNMHAELVNGEDVTVFIDTNGTENNTQYYRYLWDETYKIVAPNHSNLDATVTNFEEFNGQVTYDVDLTIREQEEKIFKKEIETLKKQINKVNDAEEVVLRAKIKELINKYK